MNLQTVYQIRGIISKYIKKFEVFIRVGLKFIAFLYLFRTISGAEIFAGEGIFNSFAVHAVLALVATLLPNRTGILIALALVVYNVFQASFIGAVLVGLLLLILYITVARTFPDQIYFLALVPLCINWNLYLFIPLFAGMYIGTAAIVPVVVGVLVWGMLQIIQPFMILQMSESLDALPKMISDASSYGLGQMAQNNQMVYLLVISAIIILVVSLVKKLRIDYVRYIALGSGCVLGIICLIIGALRHDIAEGLMGLIFLGLLSTIVLAVLEFFNLTLNYKAAQSLEFEDEEYYYQVRLVPKINPVSKQKKEVKTITKPEKEDTTGHTIVGGLQRRGEKKESDKKEPNRKQTNRKETNRKETNRRETGGQGANRKPVQRKQPAGRPKGNKENQGVKALPRAPKKQVTEQPKQPTEAKKNTKEKDLADLFFDE